MTAVLSAAQPTVQYVHRIAETMATDATDAVNAATATDAATITDAADITDMQTTITETVHHHIICTQTTTKRLTA